jgi:integrase
MGQYGKPWRRGDRGSWYAHVRGRKVRLTGPEGTQRDAQAEFARLSAGYEAEPLATSRAGSEAVEASGLLTGQVVAQWLDHQKARVKSGDLAEITWRSYSDRLKSLPDELGDTPVAKLRPAAVRAWVESQGWGQTRKHDATATIKLAFRWAQREGLIHSNPLDPLRLPRRSISRESIPSTADLERFAAEIKISELRELYEFILATGCRPGEAARARAGDYRPGSGSIVLPGKSTHRTGQKRQIVLPTGWIPRIEATIKARPGGHLFVNSRGNPWTKDAIGHAFRRCRERAGLGSDVVAYALRHRCVTDLLAKGTPLAVVSAIVGHASSTITSRIYSHLDQAVDLMRAELSR